MITVAEDEPQIKVGKGRVEEYLREKGAADFEWVQHSDTRTHTVSFSWEGSRHSVQIGHISLSDLNADSQKDENLKALWENKSKSVNSH